MYKKTIFTLLLFLVSIALIEHNKHYSSSPINNNKYVKIRNDNHHHLINRLFEGDKENIIEIKNCWEEGDLLSQKRYCSSNEKSFHNF